MYYVFSIGSILLQSVYVCVRMYVRIKSDVTKLKKKENTLKFIYAKGWCYILYFRQTGKTNMHSLCVCVCCLKMRENIYLVVEISQIFPVTSSLIPMKMMFIFILL